MAAAATSASTAAVAVAVEREHIGVAGAAAALGAFDAHLARGAPAGVAAARALAEAGPSVDWASIRDRIVASERSVILAEHPGGAVLAAKWLAAGQPTTIHDHGFAGAALVVEGTSRYERFERLDATTARLESIHDMAVGDVSWWADPPDDVHRQSTLARGGATGSLELVLLGGPPLGAAALVDVTPKPSPLHAAVQSAWLDGDESVLAPWYAPDVRGDLNVPEWRFQVRGRDVLLNLLRDEEFSKAGRRLAHLRITPTGEGLSVETEQRYLESGARAQFREVHLLRCRDGLVVEHTAWCCGVWPAEQIAAQFASAPMERL